jgi:hypothetical protein
MPISLTTQAKAQILKAVIDQITGDQCILEDRENSIKIILTEKQKKWFQDFLDKQLNMKTKPDIEIDALGVILPVILKRVWPYLLALGGGAAAIILGKRKA